ncbi:MAG: MarR family transcriptional regulator [Sphingomonadales bacterium]|nr:MarR family transcriptional regulator [Sphingomonadales bacterium]
MLDREALMHLMGKIWNAYGLRLDQTFKDAGVFINAEQFRFLDLVRERPGQYQEIYARALGRDRSSTTRMVQSLLRKGWITRIPEKELPGNQNLDTRIKRIYLSDKGSKILELVAQPVRLALLPLWENMAGEEREMLELLLKRIYSNIL